MDDEPLGGQWMNSKQAAEYLGVQYRTLVSFVNVGRLRAFRFGRVIRYRVADLDDRRRLSSPPSAQPGLR